MRVRVAPGAQNYMNLLKKIEKFPEKPGVYLMKGRGGDILYIGKAANLKKRVKSYFLKANEERTERLLSEVKNIDYKLTDNTVEALILESQLIKKYQPKYNIREKDDKSFLYVLITPEKFPRVILIRGKEIKKIKGKLFGPFTSASNIREALKIIRKIFPYNLHSQDKIPQNKPCFDYQIGLCPGTCLGIVPEKEYRKTIKNIELFLSGHKKEILKKLEKEMREAAQNLEFEKAEKIKKQIFALNHIQDVSLISDEKIKFGESFYRIECYDISNISGQLSVGSMVVFLGDNPLKSEYKRFKIKTVKGINDFKMIEEVLRRRLKHKEWPMPDLILIDGGKGQVNVARSVLSKFKLNIPVLGIAKGPKRSKNEIIGEIPSWTTRDVLIRARDEAHRFAINYHRKLRGFIK